MCRLVLDVCGVYCVGCCGVVVYFFYLVIVIGRIGLVWYWLGY